MTTLDSTTNLTRQERAFDERRRHSTVDRLAQRLERLGYRVHLEPMATTATSAIVLQATLRGAAMRQRPKAETRPGGMVANWSMLPLPTKIRPFATAGPLREQCPMGSVASVVPVSAFTAYSVPASSR